MRRILPEPEIRIKPDTSLFIVNIVLLLILFFLATGRFLNTPDQAVDLSKTNELPVESLPKPLLVVRDDGLELDGVAVPTEGLAQALEGATRLHVLIARDRPATELVALLSREEFADLELRLVTIRTPDEGQAP
jgi:biopolymer transport protein ExbD